MIEMQRRTRSRTRRAIPGGSRPTLVLACIVGFGLLWAGSVFAAWLG